MRPTTAESTLHALIATVPDQRLREVVVELILTDLRRLAARSSEPAVPTGTGRRRPRLSARRAAENAKRRERRLTNADGAPKRRGRRPKANADAPGNGSEPTANGRSGVSPGSVMGARRQARAEGSVARHRSRAWGRSGRCPSGATR